MTAELYVNALRERSDLRQSDPTDAVLEVAVRIRDAGKHPVLVLLLEPPKLFDGVNTRIRLPCPTRPRRAQVASLRAKKIQRPPDSMASKRLPRKIVEWDRCRAV